jgi:hypothetical protein
MQRARTAARRQLEEAGEIRMATRAARDTAEVRYVIHSIGQDGYWSNEAGWGGFEAATVFSPSEQGDLRLPLGGQWVAVKPYSVLLLYPDYLDDTGYETYYACVDAPNAIAGVAVARQKAAAAQAEEIEDPIDFHPLLVVEGWHASQPLWNK